MSGNDIEVQFSVRDEQMPGAEAISAWADAALDGHQRPAELSLRVVDEQDMHELNLRYRQQDKSTNVLSFPCAVANVPAMLGDLVICWPVVEREAAEQGKSSDAHFAHMVVHGVLHLLGCDHQGDAEAVQMEARERKLLAGLGFDDPYRGEAHD